MKLFYVMLLMVCSTYVVADAIKFDSNDAGQEKNGIMNNQR